MVVRLVVVVHVFVMAMFAVVIWIDMIVGLLVGFIMMNIVIMLFMLDVFDILVIMIWVVIMVLVMIIMVIVTVMWVGTNVMRSIAFVMFVT